jgi:hypothetical protein
MLLVFLLRCLGFKNKHITTLRPGVVKFAAFSLAGLLLFIAVVSIMKW